MYSTLVVTEILFVLQGGDVLQETISANVSDDVVMLEFQRSDGTLVTQLVDFRQVSFQTKTIVRVLN